MRTSRKLALGAGALVATLLLVLVSVPLLFRDRIAARLQGAVASAVNAQVRWGDVGLSALRDFPNLTLSLDRLSVVGVGPFAGDTLASVARARLVLDLGSVVGYLRSGDHLVIREIALATPRTHLHVLPDGRASWNIARSQDTTTSTSAKAVGVTLRSLRITDGAVRLDDEQSHLALSVAGLQESLRGDFGQTKFTLGTRTHADSVSVRFAGVPYLSHVALDLNADVAADMAAHRFVFKNDSLRLNRLLLAFGGAVTLGKPNVDLDLAFSTPGTAFADILSLVPAVYSADFARLQTAGSMSTTGRVRGSYGPGAFPALALRAQVMNGAFRDPSLPLPARDIYLDLAIDNPGGHVDRTVVNLRRFHANVGGRPLDATMVLRTPVSDPDVDLRVVGAVDLADVGRTVKLQGVSELRGLVSADLLMRARRSDVDAHRYERVDGRGTLGVSHLAVRAAAVPHPIAIDTAALRFTPRAAELTALVARAGRSDVRATGSLDNLLGFLLHDDELRGSATVASTLVDLNEWASKEKTTTVVPVPPRIDFTLAASAAQVTYGAITATNVRGGLRVKDQRVTLNDLHLETMRGSLVANGYYETTVASRPTFDVDLRLASVDIPSAFAALTTVQTLAPVARWAQGGVSGTAKLRGALGGDMTPVFSALTGSGAFETERLVMQHAPVLEKLAETLKLDQFRSPSLGTVKAAFDVADGQVHVKPFAVSVGGMNMTVAGSNGIDQSIKYDLGLALPRALLRGSAGQVVSDLAGKAGKVGLDLNAEFVQVGALVTGTVTNPAVRASLAGAAGSVREAAQQAVATRLADARQKVDSAAQHARERAQVEADRIMRDAEAQAARVREEARVLADRAKAEGNQRADSLLARATSPAARFASRVVVDRVRRDADAQAERIVREAGVKADGIVAQARRQADGLVKPGA